MRLLKVILLSSTLVFIACPGGQKSAEKTSNSEKYETEMPKGFKSIHQLELEAHQDTDSLSADSVLPSTGATGK